MDRTYVITGAASGIGAATAHYLRDRGVRVIACDLHEGDVAADLATKEGRAALIDGVMGLSGGRIDAIVANAGGGPPQTSLSLNFFGAVATLEGLRPFLAASPAPRAVAVSSIASLRPPDGAIFEACLGLDESAALAAAAKGGHVGDALALYSNAKHALNAWCRRAAVPRMRCERRIWAMCLSALVRSGVAAGAMDAADHLRAPRQGMWLAEDHHPISIAINLHPRSSLCPSSLSNHPQGLRAPRDLPDSRDAAGAARTDPMWRRRSIWMECRLVSHRC